MGVRSAQDGAVEAEQEFARWHLGQEQGEKHLSGELRIVDAAFHAAPLGVEIAVSWHLWSQVTVSDAFGADHRQDEIHHASQGVDPQDGHARFEMLGEFGSVGNGGF